MQSRSNPRGARRWRAVGAVVLACAALAGCATTASPFAARVTAFQQWPADAVGQTYRFAPRPGSAQGVDDLEYRSYEDIIRANLGGIGLVEAQAWERQPRFTVSFRYGSEPFQTWAEVAAPPPPPPMMGYGFYGRRGWGMGMGMPFGGWGGGWGWGYPGYSGYQAVPVTAYRNILEISIRDSQRGGAEVYQGRAVHEGRADALPQAMPYLAAAIFSNFPQNNGETRTVSIPR